MKMSGVVLREKGFVAVVSRGFNSSKCISKHKTFAAAERKACCNSAYFVRWIGDYGIYEFLPARRVA